MWSLLVWAGELHKGLSKNTSDEAVGRASERCSRCFEQQPERQLMYAFIGDANTLELLRFTRPAKTYTLPGLTRSGQMPLFTPSGVDSGIAVLARLFATDASTLGYVAPRIPEWCVPEDHTDEPERNQRHTNWCMNATGARGTSCTHPECQGHQLGHPPRVTSSVDLGPDPDLQPDRIRPASSLSPCLHCFCTALGCTLCGWAGVNSLSEGV